MSHRFQGLHRAARRLTSKAVLRPAIVAAAAAAVTFGGIAPASAKDVTVRPGDTLSKLAAAHGTTWQSIYRDNRATIGGNPNVLRVGQVLDIGGSGGASPAPARGGTYVVRAGDTLGKIAARHGTTWQRLHALNRQTIGSNPNVLRVGQRLKVSGTPSTRAARAAAPERASRSAVRPSGDARSIARSMVASRGWSSGQFACLDQLWQRESGWNHRAQNPSSGAYGIPQSLPGSKMASAGSDWRTNPATQIRWGLGYIADRYGTPCGAWSHFQSRNWY
jgi:LysM repeat protein